LPGTVAVPLSVWSTALAAGTALSLSLPRLPLTAKSRRLSGALRLTRTAMATIALVVAMRIELATRGAKREVRSLALRRLTFRARKRRANQTPVDRPLLVVALGCVNRFGIAAAISSVRRRNLDCLVLLDVLGQFDVFGHGVFGHGRLVMHVRGNPWRTLDQLRGRLTRFSATGGRHFGVLVLVLRVARRAARLLDGLVNHRDHRMVRYAALTRTIVIEDVTEPKPALLH
jgi:hypothetical protein